VKAGSTVTVRNTSGVEHTLTIATANIDVDVPGGGGTATFTAPTQPGTYVLSCDFHPSMKGTLVVVA
jgi:plastocyanin